MSLVPVEIEDHSLKVMLFEASSGEWFVRGYRESDHDDIVDRFKAEAERFGVSVTPRGGTNLLEFRSNADHLITDGKSFFRGPIQNPEKFEELMRAAFPGKSTYYFDDEP